MKKIYTLLAIIAMGLQLNAQNDLVITEIMYQPPGGNTPEYLELYNNGTSNIDLFGYTIVSPFQYFFDYSHVLTPGDYVVLTNDSVLFEQAFSISAKEFTGWILNAGSKVKINDANGNPVDSVEYTPDVPWPTIAAGQGSSIQLCDANSDNNDPANWMRSIDGHGTNLANNRVTYGTPGAANNCTSDPILQFELTMVEVLEGVGNAELTILIDNTNNNTTTVEVSAIAGTGSVTDDITFSSPEVVTIPANYQGEIPFTVAVVDDTTDETAETITFKLGNATNSAMILNDEIVMTIDEDPNDKPVDAPLVFTGIADDEASGATRLLEVYVRQDVADMSIFGMGCANNGGGTDGVEWNFPAVSASKGDVIYLTNDLADFFFFYEVNADYEIGGFGVPTSYNGNDAIELFENGRKIDSYGYPDVDGQGETWEYTDGWAKRVESTGPDYDQFIEANWNFNMGELAGYSKNDDATNPYPFGYYYEYVGIENATEKIEDLVLFPNPAANYLNILTSETNLEIKVFNLLGNQVYYQNLGPNKVINTSSWSSGVYLVQVSSDSGVVEQFKVVKE